MYRVFGNYKKALWRKSIPQYGGSLIVEVRETGVNTKQLASTETLYGKFPQPASYLRHSTVYFGLSRPGQVSRKEG